MIIDGHEDYCDGTHDEYDDCGGGPVEEVDDDLHASWCSNDGDSTHGDGGECIDRRELSSDDAEMVVELDAVPTDHAYIHFPGGYVYSLAGLDWLIAELTALREPFQVSCDEEG